VVAGIPGAVEVDMKTLYFLRGLPASGKTTWAKKKLAALNLGGKRRAVRTNKDEIRARLRAKGISGESKVIGRETELVTKALKAGLHVIIDNTHFNPIHEWRYRDLAKEYGHKFEIVNFTDVPLEECIRRDQKRRNYVGETVIWRMDDYRRSLRRGVVAALKKQWTAKKAATAKRAAAAAAKAALVVAKKAAAKKSAPLKEAKKVAAKKSPRTAANTPGAR
jgi:predicted kinase